MDSKFSQEIFNTLSKLPYFVMDKDTNEPIPEDKMKEEGYVDEHMRMQLPDETLRNGGNCWDTSICIAYFAHENNLRYIIVYTEHSSGTHTFILVREEDGKWYHPEVSDGLYLGNHGPIDDPYEYIETYIKEYPMHHNGDKISRVKMDFDVSSLFDNTDPDAFLRYFDSSYAKEKKDEIREDKQG